MSRREPILCANSKAWRCCSRLCFVSPCVPAIRPRMVKPRATRSRSPTGLARSMDCRQAAWAPGASPRKVIAPQARQSASASSRRDPFALAPSAARNAACFSLDKSESDSAASASLRSKRGSLLMESGCFRSKAIVFKASLALPARICTSAERIAYSGFSGYRVHKDR